jgi:ribonuclease HI
MTSKKISVYSDGSSGGASKGCIGWGYIITDWEEILATGSGGASEGTNNVAELHGAIEGLRVVIERKLHEGNVVELVSDSTYVLGLASGTFDAQKNLDLAAEIRKLTILTSARTRWVRGHSGEAFNEKCDELAKFARDRLEPERKQRRRSRRREERRRKRAIVKAYKRGTLIYSNKGRK